MARNTINSITTKQNREKILIISDGITEICYIEGYINKHTKLKHKYNIKFKKEQKNTITILRYIKNIYYQYSYIIALSDKDDINNKKTTYNSFCTANKSYDNLLSGYSNPCFEIWLYLHENYRETFIQRSILRKKFEKLIGKKYKTNENLIDHFEENINVAIENSSKLQEFWKNKKDPFWKRNPSTNLHKVISLLKELDSE